MTWREFIAAAPHAQRRQVYRAALDAGFTFRQIAEAAGVVASTVHHITGARRRASLDDPVPHPSEEAAR